MVRLRTVARPALAELSLFSGLTNHESAEIARLGTPVQAEPGRVLIRQGHTGREFLVVLSGCARCEIDGRVVARFGAGDFFGEVALLDGGPRTASVTAVTPMHVLVFTAGEFALLISASGEVAYRVMRQLSGRLRSASAA